MKVLVISSMLAICVAVARPPVVAGNRTPSQPYISGDGFRSFADHVYDETDQSLRADEIQHGDIVFVKSDKLGTFFTDVHANVQCQYILISHNSDASAPGEFSSYLDDERIVYWLGQNPSIIGHDKFMPIPIGVANRYVGQTGTASHFQHYASGLKSAEKTCLVGINFNPGTNRPEREIVYNKFIAKPFCRDISSGSHAAYLENMHKAKYTLSPTGNGLDCHRTWEALIVGSIPILKSSCLNPLLEGLPVVVVDDWSIIDEAFLLNQYSELNQRFSDAAIQKISYEYWHEHIKTYQKRLKERD